MFIFIQLAVIYLKSIKIEYLYLFFDKAKLKPNKMIKENID